jgi:DNA-binding PadR family transcriptional regulator
MARVNGTRQVVLGFLTWKPMSGYDIKGFVERSVSNFWSESYGQIYPTLKALVAEGLAAKQPASAKGERLRQVYSITPKGREAFRKWIQDPVNPAPSRNELLLKLFFARQVGGEIALGQVLVFKEQLLQLSQHYEVISAQCARELGDQPDLPYWRLTLEYGRLEAEAHLAWCDKAIAALRKIERSKSRAGQRGRKK